MRLSAPLPIRCLPTCSQHEGTDIFVRQLSKTVRRSR
jgi:hypothetical protein